MIGDLLDRLVCVGRPLRSCINLPQEEKMRSSSIRDATDLLWPTVSPPNGRALTRRARSPRLFHHPCADDQSRSRRPDDAACSRRRRRILVQRHHVAARRVDDAVDERRQLDQRVGLLVGVIVLVVNVLDFFALVAENTLSDAG